MANGLGRGLGSLIPQKNLKDNITGTSALAPVIFADDKDRILQLDVDKIEANPMQPRHKFSDVNMEELVDLIRQYGIIQPLIATRKGDHYELIAGERRLRASKTVGLKKVPAIVREAQEHEKLELALIENIQRENLNSIDLANAYQKLIDEFNLTQEEMAKRVGKARPSITNTLRLLNLPEEIQLAIIDGRISEGHAKFLIGLDSETKQMNLFRKILHSNLSVQDTNQEAKRMGGTKAARIKINYTDKDKEFAFREFFGAKVEVRRKGKGGQIIIDFYSDEELGEIVKKVKK